MERWQTPWQILQNYDPQIYDLITEEAKRQKDGLELIASENFASPQVIACMANIMTNKYAEGLPHKRYYGGCEVVDQAEDIAIERLKKLFNANYANVQPHSGAQANAAAFLALIKAGEAFLGMDLSHGGHLTHGSKVNFSGLLYEAHSYGLDPTTELLDLEIVREQAKKIRPKLIIAGASAYPRKIDFSGFAAIAKEVDAKLMVDMAHIAGLVAAGLHQNPVAYADVVTSTTHKTLRGPRGGIILWNNEELAINKAVFPGIQGGPLEHIIAAKAVCFKEAAASSFVEYQTRVIENCQTLADELQESGFKLVTNGTDNHLLLIDLSATPVTGKQLEEALGKVLITVNKNTVPNEKRSPFITSGVRMGTPALTSRGMGKNEMKQIASMVKSVFDNINDECELNKIKQNVLELTSQFPLYSNWGF